jgi:hypothetical protein
VQVCGRRGSSISYGIRPIGNFPLLGPQSVVAPGGPRSAHFLCAHGGLCTAGWMRGRRAGSPGKRNSAAPVRLGADRHPRDTFGASPCHTREKVWSVMWGTSVGWKRGAPNAGGRSVSLSFRVLTPSSQEELLLLSLFSPLSGLRPAYVLAVERGQNGHFGQKIFAESSRLIMAWLSSALIRHPMLEPF